MSEKVRSRNWCMMLYPEDPSHADCMKKLEECGYSYCAILHNEDSWTEKDPKFNPEKHKPGDKKKEHWHVVLKFTNAKFQTALAKELGINENYLECCKNIDGALLYLVHYGHDDKFQYDHESVFGSLKPHLMKLLADDDEGSRVLQIIKFIDDSPGIVTYREALVKACNNGLYGEFRRLGSGVKFLIDEHNDEFIKDKLDRIALKADRERFKNQLGKDEDAKWVHRCKKDYVPKLPLE